MKKSLILYFTIWAFTNACFAATETENINTVLKSGGYEPNYFSIVLSLFFVILLIYVTGILYTKLNKVGVDTVKKEFKNSLQDKPVILSTTPIGHDKTLQVVEIAGEKLLIGVSQNSVNLIKSLGKIDIKDEETPVEIKKTAPQVENTIKEEHIVNTEEFGLYKKYLR